MRVYSGWRPNGTPIQTTKTVRASERRAGAGSRLADNELASMVADVSAGRLTAGQETVATLLDLWLDHCESIGHSPTTLRKYRQLAEGVIRPELGRIRLSKLTARHLDQLYAKMTAKGNRPLTVRRLHTVLGAMLSQGERWNLVPRNVARKARPPTVHTEQIRPNAVTHFMADISKSLGFKTHLHALRHFSATELIAQGHDVRTVAGRLGHADASITLRVYSHGDSTAGVRRSARALWANHEVHGGAFCRRSPSSMPGDICRSGRSMKRHGRDHAHLT